MKKQIKLSKPSTRPARTGKDMEKLNYSAEDKELPRKIKYKRYSSHIQLPIRRNIKKILLRKYRTTKIVNLAIP